METQERLHALDALRAFALFLGIYFHASLSFLPSIDGWVVTDTSTSNGLLVVSGFSHLFRMSLFFFIAGYFARLLYHRHGLRRFLWNRAQRIALPLVLFLPVMVPLLGVIWRWGAQVAGVPIAAPAPLSVRNFPLTHLWFLYFLLWMYVLAVGARELFVRLIDRSGRMRVRLDGVLVVALSRRVAPLLFALPLALAALAVPEWHPSIGIASPDRSLIPSLVPLVGFGTAFGAGWICQRNSKTLQLMCATRTASLWLSMLFVVVTAALVFSLAQSWSRPWWAWFQFASALSVAATIWYWNLFLVGFALKHLSTPSPARRYAADASYWLYVAHLPLVTGLQVVAARSHLHWSIELAAILVVSTAVLLLSYHWWVRSTWLGAMLNGRRYPRGLPHAATAEAV
jgi:peptidoglycan/LPS O-acetylase OafA/YrhL